MAEGRLMRTEWYLFRPFYCYLADPGFQPLPDIIKTYIQAMTTILISHLVVEVLIVENFHTNVIHLIFIQEQRQKTTEGGGEDEDDEEDEEEEIKQVCGE